MREIDSEREREREVGRKRKTHGARSILERTREVVRKPDAPLACAQVHMPLAGLQRFHGTNNLVTTWPDSWLKMPDVNFLGASRLLMKGP